MTRDTLNKYLCGMASKYSILYVKIYDSTSVVEDADGNELKTGTLDQHAELVKWASERADKVDYDS